MKLCKTMLIILLGSILCLAPVIQAQDDTEKKKVTKTSATEGNQAFMAKSWPAVSLPHTKVVVSSTLDDRVENVETILVEEGQRVEQGDILLKFETDQIDSQIAIMEAEADYEARIERQKQRVDYLEREYKRSKKLSSGEAVISESKLDNDHTKWKLAKSELKDLKRQARKAQNQLKHYQARRDDYIIKAPVDGVISKIWIEEGEMAREGEKVMEVVDPDVIEVRTHIPEEYVGDIQLRQEGAVRFPCADQKSLVASVYFISPYVDSSSGTFLVKALAEDPSRDIIPGMGCEVQFNPFEVRAETEASPE